MVSGLEKCAPLLYAARFLERGDLDSHSVSAALGGMDFVLTYITKKLFIFTAQQGLLLLLPFEQQKLIHLPKE